MYQKALPQCFQVALAAVVGRLEYGVDVAVSVGVLCYVRASRQETRKLFCFCA